MATGAKKIQKHERPQATPCGRHFFYDFGGTKTVNKVSYSAFDTQNWLTVKDLGGATSQGGILNAKHISITGDSVVAAMPMSPECGLLVYKGSGNCRTENEPGPMEIDSVRNSFIMGLSPLDRNYLAINVDTKEILNIKNISAQLEGPGLLSLSSHIDNIFDNDFISASAVKLSDDYFVSMSSRDESQLISSNAFNLKDIFFPDPNYEYRSLAT
jgi:hypothetical protein